MRQTAPSALGHCPAASARSPGPSPLPIAHLKASWMSQVLTAVEGPGEDLVLHVVTQELQRSSAKKNTSGVRRRNAPTHSFSPCSDLTGPAGPSEVHHGTSAQPERGDSCCQHRAAETSRTRGQASPQPGHSPLAPAKGPWTTKPSVRLETPLAPCFL